LQYSAFKVIGTDCKQTDMILTDFDFTKGNPLVLNIILVFFCYTAYMGSSPLNMHAGILCKRSVCGLRHPDKVNTIKLGWTSFS
jgi:hypothetical protein